jgi:hypothetical protein
VAEVYSEAFANGENPTRAVQRRFGVSYGSAAAYVRRARHDYGFLAPTEPGKAGGRLVKARAHGHGRGWSKAIGTIVRPKDKPRRRK